MVLQTRDTLHRHENLNISRNLNTCSSKNVWVSGVPRAGLGGGVLNPSYPEIPKALQNRAKINPIVKTVKNCWI